MIVPVKVSNHHPIQLFSLLAVITCDGWSVEAERTQEVNLGRVREALLEIPLLFFAKPALYSARNWLPSLVRINKFFIRFLSICVVTG